MTLSVEQKQHAVDLLETGDKLEAVRYLQEVLKLDAEQALQLTEKLEQETKIEADAEFVKLEKRARALEGMNTTLSNIPRNIGVTGVLIGLIFTGIALYLTGSYYLFSKKAERVNARVTGFDQTQIINDQKQQETIYLPVLEYTWHGSQFTYHHDTGSSTPGYEIGESVEILLDPADKSKIIIPSASFWITPIVFLFLGVLFMGIGYAVYRAFGGKSTLEPV